MVKTVRRRRVVRKRRAGPKRMRKAGGRSGAKRVSDYAKCVEIQETQLVATADNTGENLGGVMNFCLADYQRPQEIAHAFKYYRASQVEIRFIPYANTYQAGLTAATRLPQLYYSVDRLSNRWIAPSETECLERGISPKVFNKMHKLTFKPNLLQEISLETNQPANGQGQPLGFNVAGFMNATALFNKWLPTQQSMGYNENIGTLTQVGQQVAPIGVNPYALRYHGAIFNVSIEGQTPGSTIPAGDIQLKVTWEFKGPRALKTAPPQQEANPYAVTSSQGAANAVPNTQPTTYP